MLFTTKLPAGHEVLSKRSADLQNVLTQDKRVLGTVRTSLPDRKEWVSALLFSCSVSGSVPCGFVPFCFDLIARSRNRNLFLSSGCFERPGQSFVGTLQDNHWISAKVFHAFYYEAPRWTRGPR